METSYQTLIACRGWHVYGKTVWCNPSQDEILHLKKEESQAALIHDPHSIAFTRKIRARLVPDIVGHIPLEISRYVWFFMNRGGRVTGTVHDPRYRPSPIPKGGLEIILKVTFTIKEEDKRYLERLRSLISKNYQTPSETRKQDGQDDTMVGDKDDIVGGSDEEDSEETLDVNFMSDEEIETENDV